MRVKCPVCGRTFDTSEPPDRTKPVIFYCDHGGGKYDAMVYPPLDPN